MGNFLNFLPVGKFPIFPIFYEEPQREWEIISRKFPGNFQEMGNGCEIEFPGNFPWNFSYFFISYFYNWKYMGNEKWEMFTRKGKITP